MTAAKEIQEKVIQKVKLCCESENNFSNSSKYLIEKANSGNEQFVKPIIDTIKKIIKDSKEQASKKFYALLLLKHCMDIGHKSLLAYVIKKILERLKKLARKANDGEGRFIFGSKPLDPAACAKFSQLLLECIQEWAVKYALSGNGLEPTKYKSTYSELIKKIKFPHKSIYFPKNKDPPNNTNNKPAEKKNEILKSSNAMSLNNSNKPKFNEKIEEEKKNNAPERKSVAAPKQENEKKKDGSNLIKKVKENREIILNTVSLILELEDVEKATIDAMMEDLKSACKFFMQINVEELYNNPDLSDLEKIMQDVLDYNNISYVITENYSKVEKNQISISDFKSYLRIEFEKLSQNEAPQKSKAKTPDVKKDVASLNILNPPPPPLPPITKINSSVTLEKKEIKESNNSKVTKEIEFNQNPINKTIKLEEKNEPIKRKESNHLPEKNPFGDFSQPKGGKASFNQFEFGGLDTNKNIERKDSEFQNPFEEKNIFKNSEFQANIAFNQFGEADHQNKNFADSSEFAFKLPNEEKETNNKSDAFFADFNYQTNFNKNQSQANVNGAKLSSKQSLSKEGGDELYFEDFNKFNFDIGLNQSNHNFKQTGFDDFFKNNSSEIKPTNDFNFDFGNSNFPDPFKHEETEQSSSIQNNFKKKRFTFHEEHNPFEFQNNYHGDEGEEPVENENQPSQKDLEESKHNIELPNIKNSSNDFVNRNDNNQQNMQNFMKNKSDPFLEGDFNNFGNFQKNTMAEHLESNVQGFQKKSVDQNFEKDFEGFGFQPTGINEENHEGQNFNGFFDVVSKEKNEENKILSQKNNYFDVAQSNKVNNIEEENLFNNKLNHTTSQYFQVEIPIKNKNIDEMSINNDFDEGWKEVPQWGFNQQPEKNVSKNEIFNQWEEKREDIANPPTKTEINCSPFNAFNGGFGFAEPRNKEIENLKNESNNNGNINGSIGWNYDNQIKVIPEIISKKTDVFEKSNPIQDNDVYMENFHKKTEAQEERMHYPSLHEEKYNHTKNWVEFSEKNENETSMKSSFPKPVNDFEKPNFVADNNASFEFIDKELKTITSNLEQEKIEIIQEKPNEYMLDFKNNSNKANDFNFKSNNLYENEQNMGYQYPTINEPANYIKNINNCVSFNSNSMFAQNGLISQAQKNEKSLLDWGVDEITSLNPDIVNESSLNKEKNSDFLQISENLKDLNFNVNLENNQDRIKNSFSEEKDLFSQPFENVNYPQVNKIHKEAKEEKKMNEKQKNDGIIKEVFAPSENLEVLKDKYIASALSCFEKNLKEKQENILEEFKQKQEKVLGDLENTKHQYEELKDQLEKTIHDVLPNQSNTPFFQGINKNELASENEALKNALENLAIELNSIKNNTNNTSSFIKSPSPIKNDNSRESPLKELSMNETSNYFEDDTRNFLSYQTIFRKRNTKKEQGLMNFVSTGGNNYFTVQMNFLQELNSTFSYRNEILPDYKNKLHYSKDKRDILFQSPEKKSKKNSTFIEFKEKDWQKFINETSLVESDYLNLDNFKYSCANEKGVLFENEYIQIGSITNKIQDTFLKNNFYFGNKTKLDIAIEKIEVFNYTFMKRKNFQINQFNPNIKPFSQSELEVIIDHSDFGNDKFLMIATLKMDSFKKDIKIPLPTTLNKLFNAHYVYENYIKEKWMQSRCFVSPFLKCNSNLINDIFDFQRFYPEFIELSSKNFRKIPSKKKIGTIININHEEYVLRVILNEKNEFCFQMGSFNDENPKMIANLLDNFCFIFKI